ncbi:alpha/beta fold hydrolase [Nocardia sp. CA-135398]|uniref:alpha/beta fold hydrolase n=1 Tax=Nocardia sp. CA-135398 TaxID=3239977 RepID=UPI003D98599B
MDGIRSRYVLVDGIRTHYLEAGDGEETVVLLHGGAFGEDAWLSWEKNIPALAERYRVVAPDWLGFGGTDKIRDFVSGAGRMIDHMTQFLRVMCIEDAHFGGLSMGGSMLIKVAAAGTPQWPIRSVFLASGGGFIPANEARQVLLDYDQTVEKMRSLVRVAYADPKWASDDEFVKRRWENSLIPGAWEASASARFKAPSVPPRSDFGQADDTPYEQITVPVLYTAGGKDQLREPGYAADIAARTPKGRVVEFPHCGHVLNFEAPEEWNELVLKFLTEISEQR